MAEWSLEAWYEMQETYARMLENELRALEIAMITPVRSAKGRISAAKPRPKAGLPRGVKMESPFIPHKAL